MNDSEYTGEGTFDENDKRFIKFHVSGVTVKKIAERVQYYDTDGKLNYTFICKLKDFKYMKELEKWNVLIKIVNMNGYLK